MTTQTISATVVRPTRAGGRVRTVASWVLQVALASQFAMAGIPKLAGDPMMVGMFDTLGAGQWLRYVVGSLEVAGAVGLLIAPVAGIAAIGLFALMIGAAVSSVGPLATSPAIPLTVAAVAAVVVVLRRHRLLDFVTVIRRYAERTATTRKTR